MPTTIWSARLERLNDIGAALSSQTDLPGLLERVLVAAKDITRTGGGTFYLCSDDRSRLRFAIPRNDSLGLSFSGSAGRRPESVSPICRYAAPTVVPTTTW
ncbi:hypothetical protein [Oryzomicrobium sp.]|uniref:hypothetical protein n=1 Tax=Oryzomicrobium sp. TaxID=1911578 RepID=UPI0025D479F8|nr:hypothetical protein [Oryzomicrobium sp.]MCE1243868.1 hypothetical protein [Oryzomicrobium sp.]